MEIFLLLCMEDSFLFGSALIIPMQQYKSVDIIG